MTHAASSAASPGFSPVTVRSALDGELAAAGECVRAAYEADGLANGEYLGVIADARARARSAEVLVAVGERGDVLGSVTFLLPGSPFAELARSGEAEFRMLGVLPAARGRGVARALVEACLDRATRVGAHRVVLCSQVAMTSAHRLYAQFGFVRAPELDWVADPDVELLGFAVDVPGGRVA